MISIGMSRQLYPQLPGDNKDFSPNTYKVPR